MVLLRIPVAVPLVRLIIFLFRGIGRMFQAIGRFLRALVGAGMRSFLLKSVEVVLRLGFVASLVALVAVCGSLFGSKHYLSGSYEAVGPRFSYKFDTYNNYDYRVLRLHDALTQFVPKDAKVPYGPGKLDVDGVLQVWKTNEMVHVSGTAVKWDVSLGARNEETGRPMLMAEDFAPRSWDKFTAFFEQAWAIISLPMLVAWLVFPSASRLRERVRRACLLAPLCAVASFGFAYLFSRYWLNTQYDALAELVIDLPRWAHPVGILNKSILAGLAISLIPMALWYLLRWVLGPFFATPTTQSSP